MQLTHHAQRRIAQRALPLVVVDLVMRIGEEIRSNRGCKIRLLNSKILKSEFMSELKALGHKAEHKWCNLYLVVAEGNVVITAGYRYKRLDAISH
jgi:hypothetical protein